MSKPDPEQATCPVCHGRGEVSRFYRDYIQRQVSARPGWEEVALVLLVQLLIMGCAWLGVRSWDREAALAEEQARQFYEEQRP